MSEYKDKWIAALRSGEYKQGRATLCATQGDGSRAYCCLGVLAELDGVLEKDPDFSDFQLGVREGVDHINAFMYTGKGEHLTSVNVDAPEGIDGGGDPLPWMVAHLNDMGWSFEQIADYLEKVDF